MPRSDRRTCAGCNKRIDGGLAFGCSNNLLRLFLSARALKKVDYSDAVCRKCRSKFDNWLRKVKGEFDDFVQFKSVERIMVNTFSLIETFNMFVLFQDEEHAVFERNVIDRL